MPSISTGKKRRSIDTMEPHGNIPNVVTPKINHNKPRHFKSLFKPRTSPLDFETLILEKNPFRGFFILFWLSIAMKILTSLYQSWRNTGEPISLNLAYEMFTGVESVLQADLLMPQSLFFVLHTISMLMKQHSYNSYNISLTFKKNRYAKLLLLSKKDDYTLSEDESLEMDILADELTRGEKPFPSNQTIANFFDYLLVPTLVYELHFPRTSRFRLWYFLERTFSLFVSIGLLYLVIEHQCTPVFLQMPNQTFLDTLMDLLIPCMMCYLLIFYIIFECVCNAFAELTCFADREFYADFWNASSFGDFARDWNKPVHHFLLRHVFKESMENLKISKQDATFITFFLSSCMHELVFFIIGKRLRMYLFFMQMFQLPLIFLSTLKIFKGRAILGNVFFWFGMYLGPPILTVAYLREVYL
ncbi:hypothetical protein HDV04_002141 [Boothiomyces sp. JEL0838]|nr:hypothetical protein HDV04_002141 [Boothiomyces sp. JEL0838]